MPKGFGSWVGTQGIGAGAACPAGVTCTTTSFTPAQIATALGAANDNLAYLAALNNNPAALVNTSAAIAQAQQALQQLGVTLDTSTLTSGSPTINWNALTLTNQSATWETKSLNPIAMMVINAVLQVVLGPAAQVFGAFASEVEAAAISLIDSGINGAISGNLDAGQTLENAGIAALEAAAFNAVHVIKSDLAIPQTQNLFVPNFDPVAALESANLHALVGCTGSALGGQSCASGAAAAGIGDLAGNIQTGSQLGQFLVTSLAGGLGAKIAGGDFATGALQGGFGYLFNDLMLVYNKNAFTLGQGHIGDAIGNDQIGWVYTSKNGLSGSQIQYYPTAQALLAANPDYTNAIIIPTTSEQDTNMIYYANQNYGSSYNLLLNNCADLVLGILHEGNIQVEGDTTFFGFNSPKLIFYDIQSTHQNIKTVK